ncbi:MAG: hypothetical protein U5Q44_11090 [Dehalococcoidia bacterium]|nr:hypothetical protein [Dehalococcoidia bacterium]
MAGRHTITIELDDDEYRALEAEADRIGADVESAMHGLRNPFGYTTRATS